MNWKALIDFQPQASLKQSRPVTQECQERYLFVDKTYIQKRDKYAHRGNKT